MTGCESHFHHSVAQMSLISVWTSKKYLASVKVGVRAVGRLRGSWTENRCHNAVRNGTLSHLCTLNGMGLPRGESAQPSDFPSPDFPLKDPLKCAMGKSVHQTWLMGRKCFPYNVVKHSHRLRHRDSAFAAWRFLFVQSCSCVSLRARGQEYHPPGNNSLLGKEFAWTSHVSQEDFRNECLFKYITIVVLIVYTENVDTLPQTMIYISICWNISPQSQAVHGGSHMVTGYS